MDASSSSSSSSSSCDGTISSADFCVSAPAFAERWNKFNPSLPQWSWVTCGRPPLLSLHQAEGYLSLENVFLPKSGEVDYDEGRFEVEEEPSCSGDEDSIDNATLVQSCGRELHHYDFHIVHSASYRVPVLYFRGYRSDGQPLMTHDIEKDLPATSGKEFRESKWTFITQEEHPYLNRPWHKLHPCGTSEWMKLLLTAADALDHGEIAVEQYLVAWFSVVGPVIGLRIPFQMLLGAGNDKIVG